MRILSSALVLLAMTMTSLADDGAASIAAGGLVMMKRETRIVMAKEVLTISPVRVAVDYDFRNDSDEDVTTEVAFPIPAYSLYREIDPKQAGFDDFKLWVGGVPVKYTIEMRALVGKRDITGDLRALHIDAASFGHYAQENREPQTAHLAPAQRKRLIALRAIDFKFGDQPLWRIEKKYHWTQTFPAHGTVHIRHQYTPVLGNSNTTGYGYEGQPASEKGVEELATLCPTESLLAALRRAGNTGKELVGLFYVDFILTTANTWKTPIEDFTLNVERDSEPDYKVNYVSFCWDGPVKKMDANHFSAHVNGLVPRKELRVGFIMSDWSNQQVKENEAWDLAHPPSRNR